MKVLALFVGKKTEPVAVTKEHEDLKHRDHKRFMRKVSKTIEEGHDVSVKHLVVETPKVEKETQEEEETQN